MLNRRLLAAAAGLLLAVPILTSCGFQYATNRVNTIGAGVSDREGSVDALGMAIVAGRDGTGNLIGTLSNNDQDSADALVAVTGDVSAELEPVEVTPGGYVNLATLVEEGEPIRVTGDFAAGDFVEITLEFESSDPVTVNIPVDKPCYKYEGLAPGSDSVGDGTEPPEAAEPPGSGDAGDTYECSLHAEEAAEH